ncbi:MAG: hypothetical protein AAF252_06595 [Pseudomonadota bacterium]
MSPIKRLELYISALFKLGKIERVAKHADFVAADALKRGDDLRRDLDDRTHDLRHTVQQLSQRLSAEVRSETHDAVRDLALRHSELAASYVDLTHRLDSLLVALAGAPDPQPASPAVRSALDGEAAFAEAVTVRLSQQHARAQAKREAHYLGHIPELEAAVLRSRADLPEDLPVLDLGGPAAGWAAVLARSDLPVAPQGAEAPLQALTARPDASLSAITAIDVAPDWPLETLIAITRQAARVLAPGGLFLLETPNPDIPSSGLYDRITPVHPVTAPVLTALFETAGFTPQEVRRLDPDPRLTDLLARPGADAELASQIFGPRRLVILGERPLGAGA